MIQAKTPLSPCEDGCIARYPQCILSITMGQVKQVLKEESVVFNTSGNEQE